MRSLIAGMQVSVDLKIEGPNGDADWVPSWSDTFDLVPQVDACLLGAAMYPGYEAFWRAIHAAPTELLDRTGELPTPEEIEYAAFAGRTPHYVLSSSLAIAAWSHTHFLRSAEEVAALKKQPGRDIYVVGGAITICTLLDAGLIDELRLTLHPLIAGPGKPLFDRVERHRLSLRSMRSVDGGKVALVYGVN